jgi:uncharacterized damage-inducible protein DinB
MTLTSTGRPHAQRIRKDLDDIRTELLQTVQGLTPDDLNWVPQPGLEMKSFKQILQEIGTMEKLTCRMAIDQEMLDWGAVWQTLEANDLETLLSGLKAIRAETLAFLDTCTEAQLETPVPLPAEWQGYFDAPIVEPEVLLRWIVRHEYYHVGQLVIYQWQRGHNPMSSHS